MPKTLVDELALEVANLKAQVKALSGDRLANASLDGTTLWLKDSDGNIAGRLGRQADGSNGVHVVKVAPPPQLTAPILTAREQAGTCLVEWDGGTFDGRTMPLIHGHTEIWAELVGEDWDATVAPGDAGKRVGTIRDRTGGEVVVALPQAGVWAVWLRAMGADRETAGPWSPVAQVEITPLVDTEAIEQELKEARDRLEQAEQDLAAGMADRKAEIEYLRNERIPQLQQALDNIQPVIEDYDDRITSAQDGAQSARDTAENLRDNILPPLQGELTDLTENRLPTVEGTLDQTRLGMENLRDIRVPELEDSLAAGILDVTDSYKRLAIADATNRIHDPDFWELPGDGIVPSLSLGVAAWMRPSGNSPTWGSWTSSGRRFMRILDPGDATLRRIGYFGAGGRGFRVEPGDEMRFTCRAHRDNPGGGSDRIQIRGRYMDIHGVEIGGWQNIADIRDGGVREYAGEFTVPADDSIRYMYLDFIAWYSAGMTGDAWIEKPMLRRKNGGELLVDGSISARHIMAESIAAAVGEFLNLTADQIDTENLAAYLATIIELDAGQITSGQINTARLDAEEVAGAVANFLTLDALEINVEQLAGEIANIIEVTAESIASGAISARHLAIADFENLLPEEAIWDFRDEGLSSPLWSPTGQGASGWRTLVNQHSRLPVALRIDSTGDLSGTSRLGFRFGGKGIAVKPGESLRLSGYGWRGTVGDGIVGVRFRWADEEGNQVSFGSNGPHRFESGWNSFSLEETVPNDDAIRYLTLDFYAQPGAPAGHWGDFSLRRMTGGELIVDGGIMARHLDAEEIFSARAVIDKIWTDIVYSELVQSGGIITEDMIATGAITTPKLTVTEEMAAEVVRVMRLEGDEMTFNYIRGMIVQASQIEGSVFLAEGPDGETTVRLDGMDNYLAGRLQAGMAEGSSITLDYGEKVRFSGLNEEGEPDPQRVISTPYLNFRTPNIQYQVNQEPSIHLDRMDPSGRNGMMIINPGYPEGTSPFRAKLNVVGDVQSNRVEPRERLEISTSHSDQPGVIQASGQGLRIRGQVPSLTHSQEMFYVGQTAQASLAPGALRKRTISWGLPVPRGRRDPIVTPYMAGVPADNNAYVVVNVSNRSTNSYRLDEYNPSTATANYWVGIIAPWRDP